MFERIKAYLARVKKQREERMRKLGEYAETHANDKDDTPQEESEEVTDDTEGDKSIEEEEEEAEMDIDLL